MVSFSNQVLFITDNLDGAENDVLQGLTESVAQLDIATTSYVQLTLRDIHRNGLGILITDIQATHTSFLNFVVWVFVPILVPILLTLTGKLWRDRYALFFVCRQTFT